MNAGYRAIPGIKHLVLGSWESMYVCWGRRSLRRIWGYCSYLRKVGIQRDWGKSCSQGSKEVYILTIGGMALCGLRHYQPEERYILVEWMNELMNE